MGRKRTPDFYKLDIPKHLLDWARQEAMDTLNDNKHLGSLDDRMAVVFLAGTIVGDRQARERTEPDPD